MNITHSPFVIKFSKFISNFFNPLVSMVIYFYFFSKKELSKSEAWAYFIPVLLFTLLPTIVWLVWNVKTGRYTNLDVSDRKQRKSLYFFLAFCVIAYLVYYYIVHHQMDINMLFIFILLLIMQLSNYFIKSSMHTAFNVFVASMFFAIDWKWGLAWFFLAILVGITRIILKRHTVKEVLMGILIASLVSFVYLYTQIQIQIQH